MDWSNTKRWAARLGATALAFVLGASASAGTLYSWKTEDGTLAYSNDKKRIPAKYKAEAKTSKLGKMQNYERFTPGPKVGDKAYADRIVERLEVLRASDASEVLSSGGEAVSQPRPFVRLGVNRGRTDVEIPLGSGEVDAEPVVVETIRMKKTNGRQSTRHFRVVKQGDNILAVIKDRIHENKPLSGAHDERDFDDNPLE
ncbi:MAG: DUF4124 domain-containing protein [Myxococcota bacterium]|jgi:hypothetical protein|nr:DUF4124 domain-containing protein [Myxococcota bacterium]